MITKTSIVRIPFLFSLTFLAFSLSAQESGNDVKSQVQYLVTSQPGSARAGAEPAGNMGNLTFPISLEVPPSRNGTDPELTLNYNSANQKHGSILGQSWSIDMSYIERSLRKGVPSYTDDDEFIISLGKAQGKLVRIDVRTDTLEFRVAHEQLFLIIYFLPIANQWVVIDKKGITYVFGDTDATRVSSGGKVFRWELRTVFNPQFIHTTTYSYQRIGNQLYPQSINYSHGRIDFSYEPHPQPFVSFKPGFKIIDNQLLHEITTFYQDTAASGTFIPASVYAFRYTRHGCAVNDKNEIVCLTPYLESITRYNGTKTDSLPPTRFEYDDPSLDLALDQVTPWLIPLISGAGFTEDDGEDNNALEILDVDGDGFPDLVQADGNDQRVTMLNNRVNGWKTTSSWRVPVIAGGGITEDDGTGDNGVRFVDVNRDGFVDIVQGDGKDQRATFLNNQINGWNTNPNWQLPVIAGAGFTEDNGEGDNGVRFTDVNNDGFMDIVQADGDNQHTTFINDQSSGWVEGSTWIIPVISGGGFTEDDGEGDNGVRLVDLNGDGLQDIVQADGNDQRATFINDIQTNAFVPNANWAIPVIAGGGFTEDDGEGDNGVRFADVNGDGFLDIIQADGNSERATFLNNTVDAFVKDDRWRVPVMRGGGFTESDGKGNNGVRIADINHDGFDDLVMADGNDMNQHLAFLNNRSDGWFLVSIPVGRVDFEGNWHISSDYQFPILDKGGFNESSGDGNNGVRFADVNADGFIDIVQADGNDSDQHVTYLNNGKNGWELTPLWQIPIVDNGGFTESDGSGDNALQMADLNSDGFPDLLMADGNAEDQHIAFINDRKGKFSLSADWSLPLIHGGGFTESDGEGDNGVRIIDVNGDSYPDIVEADGTDRATLLNDQRGQFVAVSNFIIEPIDNGGFTENGGDDDNGVRTIDINGDGLIDIVQADDADQRKVFLNRGDGTWLQNSEADSFNLPVIHDAGFTEDGGDGDNGVRFADLNFDGYVDIIQGDGGDQRDVYLNNSMNGWVKVTSWQLPLITQGGFTEEDGGGDNGLSITDVNGDGFPDIVQADGLEERRTYLNGTTRPPLLSRIDNGIGGIVDILYETRPGKPVMYTVAKISQNDGFTIDESTFLFEKPHFDQDKKESRGFGKVTAIHDGAVTETFYHQANGDDFRTGEEGDAPGLEGLVYFSRMTRQIQPDFQLQAHHNTWLLRVDRSHPDYFLPQLQNEIEYNFAEDGIQFLAQAKGYEYDVAGNIARLTDFKFVGDEKLNGHFTDLEPSDNLITVTEYARDVSPPDLIRGFPSRIMVQDVSGAILRESRIFYDQQPLGQLLRGLPTMEQKLRVYTSPDLYPRTLVTNTNPLSPDHIPYMDTIALYVYDNQGNIRSKTNPNGNTKFYFYDAHNFYLLKDSIMMRLGKPSPLALVTRYKYDPRNGAIAEVTQPNKARMLKTFDDFGRIRQVAESDLVDLAVMHTKQTFVYELAGIKNGISHNRTIRTDKQDGYELVEQEITYMDGFEGKIQCKKLMSDSTFSGFRTQSYTYNGMGKMERNFQPYFTQGDFFTTIDFTLPNMYSQYDPLGRLVQITPEHMSEGDSPVAGETTEYGLYGRGLSRTWIHGDHKTKYVYNSGGQITDIFQYIGARVLHTTYTYDILQRLVRIVDSKGAVTSFGYDSMDEKREMNDPTTGHSTYSYDGAGNLLRFVNNKQDTTIYRYDELYRILTQRFSADATQKTTYSYDENGFAGMLTTLTSASVISKYKYNNLGKVVRHERKIENKDFVLENEYDPFGRLLKIVYPDGTVVTYHYYKEGTLLKEVRETGKTVAYYEKYTALLKPLRYRYGNGAVTENVYFPANERLKDSSVKNPAGKEIQGFSYRFDDYGNVRFVENRLLLTKKAYTHDDFDRLVSVETWSGGNAISVVDAFQYDDNGNMLAKDQKTYQYEAQRPYVLSQIGSQVFSTDPNGNQTVGSGGRKYKYDVMDRLVNVKASNNLVIAAYKYDASNGRVVKAVNGITTVYIDNLFELQLQGGRKMIHIYAQGQLIGSLVNPLASQPRHAQFYHQDQLGSITLITGANAAVMSRFDYKPYGEQITVSGTTTTTFGFNGQVMDPEVGLLYYQSRYYDPVIGRFIQPDTYIPKPEDPQNLNRYTYVGNNPVTFIDPTGHWFGLDDLIAFGAGFAIGFTTTLLTTDFDFKQAFISGIGNGLGFWLIYNCPWGSSLVYYYGGAQILATTSNAVFNEDRGGTFGDVTQLVTTYAASPVVSTVGLLWGVGTVVFGDATWSDVHFVDGTLWFKDGFRGPGADAMTTGAIIHYKGDMEFSEEITTHELFHRRQYGNIGDSFVPYYFLEIGIRYIGSGDRDASYRGQSFEAEAYSKQSRHGSKGSGSAEDATHIIQLFDRNILEAAPGRF